MRTSAMVFAIVVAAGCARHGIDVPVVDVHAARELPAIEPLAPDPWPVPPDDVFIELAYAHQDHFAVAILPDGSLRWRIPGGLGCAGWAAPEDITTILRLAERIGFWSMKELYPAIPPGASPGYRITVSARGRRKTVVHYNSEHSAVVRGELKGWPDIEDRLGLIDLEKLLEQTMRFDTIAYVRPVDLARSGVQIRHAQSRLEDALATIRARCGPLQATAIQIIVRADGTMGDTGAIPGGALEGCPDEILRSMTFEPSCAGTNALFTLDAEGLNAEVHTIAPAE